VLFDNEDLLLEAIHSDFGKSPFDTIATELGVLAMDIDENISGMSNWSRKVKVPTNLINFPGRSYVIPEPLGNSLIIGAWNYPYQISLSPLIAAIAAGNTAVLKPSELASGTSTAMAEIINSNFPEEFIHVVEGGVEETTALLKLKFDKIFFTGSTRVGKIVYKAAAENLCPVTLELGGKSPAIVTRDSKLKTTARRIVWAKFLNAGQTCIAPDYALIDSRIADRFIEALIEQIKKFDYKLENDNFTRIIDNRNWERIVGLMDPEKVVFGGGHDRENRVIEPTVMRGVEMEDAVMQEEIFGPLLPVLTFDGIEEAIQKVKSLPRPLALYLFSNNSKTQMRVMREISFGGGAINETIMHIANPNLPFGGVGSSGTGSYHGEAGFRAFSHYKSILEKPLWPDPYFKYPPYSLQKEKWMRWALGWRKKKK
jgi:aldehyde dehydrogenase (NAD+)